MRFLTSEQSDSPQYHVPLVAGLTAREVEVLGLVAIGQSNRHIAKRLFISTRTIERHIANIYLKIDVHSKAEATAWARCHQLTTIPSSTRCPYREGLGPHEPDERLSNDGSEEREMLSQKRPSLLKNFFGRA